MNSCEFCHIKNQIKKGFTEQGDPSRAFGMTEGYAGKKGAPLSIKGEISSS